MRISWSLLALALAGCGANPVLYRAPDDPDLGTSEPGPDSGGFSCPPDLKAVVVDGRGVCTAPPRAGRLVDFSLAGFSLAPASESCEALSGFGADFARTFLPGVRLASKSCRQLTESPREYFVNLTYARANQQHSISFVTGFRNESPGDLVEAPYVRICTTAGDASTCREPYVAGTVPTDVARIYPAPHEAIVHFYPTLVSFLGR